MCNSARAGELLDISTTKLRPSLLLADRGSVRRETYGGPAASNSHLTSYVSPRLSVSLSFC